MPADMYSDSDGPSEQAPPESQGEHSDGDDGETAVLPKSILAGKEFKPGDEVVLKILNIHDDSVEVAYAPEKGHDEEGGMGAEEPPAMSGGGPSSDYD